MPDNDFGCSGILVAFLGCFLLWGIEIELHRIGDMLAASCR